MSRKLTVSHEEATRVLRRVGFAPELISKILAQLEDPIDLVRDEHILDRYGISRAALEDQLGGSP